MSEKYHHEADTTSAPVAQTNCLLDSRPARTPEHRDFERLGYARKAFVFSGRVDAIVVLYANSIVSS